MNRKSTSSMDAYSLARVSVIGSPMLNFVRARTWKGCVLTLSFSALACSSWLSSTSSESNCPSCVDLQSLSKGQILTLTGDWWLWMAHVPHWRPIDCPSWEIFTLSRTSTSLQALAQQIWPCVFKQLNSLLTTLSMAKQARFRSSGIRGASEIPPKRDDDSHNNSTK